MAFVGVVWAVAGRHFGVAQWQREFGGGRRQSGGDDGGAAGGAGADGGVAAAWLAASPCAFAPASGLAA